MGNVKEGKYKVIQNYNSVEGALYENEVVGECDEFLGSGVLPDITPELVCTSCEGAGIIYYGKENIN